jgi:uncharacterized protein (TIGR03437 family)
VLGFAGANASQTPDSVPLAGSVVILPSAAWPSPALALTSAAGFGLGPLAPGAIASALGVNLAPQTAQAGGTLPLSLGGANVTVTDSNGTARPAPLYYVSPAQVNYLIPPDTAAGSATVTIAAGNRVVSAGRVAIAPVAPSLFTVNAGNLAAATVVRFDANGNRTVEAIYQASPDGSITALPIDFGAPTDTVFVSLYGTGIRNLRTPGTLTATLASSVNARVSFVGPQGAFDGLDQVNIELPRSLASQSPHFTSLQLTADGQPSNLVTLFLQ